MRHRRAFTALAVVTGALLAVQIFSRWYESGLVRLIYDLFILALAMAVVGWVRPARNPRRELGRLAIGVPILVASVLLGNLLARLLYTPLIVSGNGGWLMLTRILPAFGLAWSIWSVLRIGGVYWVRRRRRVTIAVVMTFALALLDAPSGVMILMALFVALAVIPSRWLEDLAELKGWWMLALLLFSPAAFLILNHNFIFHAPDIGLQTFRPLRVSDVQLLLQSPLLTLLRNYVAFFWFILPVRVIVAFLQGTFGLRVPIWLKLSLTYIFSTLIPGLLLLALVSVAVYLGIGTMRAHIVRNLVYNDLTQLQDALQTRNFDQYAPADSVAEGIYLRIQPSTDQWDQQAPVPPPTPTRGMPVPPGRGGVFDPSSSESPLATLPPEWQGTTRIDSLLGTTGPREIWVRLASKPAAWTLPDTLPMFLGWNDSTMTSHGFLPIGGGRSAYAAATARHPGSRLVNVALRPMNKFALERYKDVVGADVTINPYNRMFLAFTMSSDQNVRSTQEEVEDPLWKTAKKVSTLADSTTDFLHRAIYEGVSELQVWPSDDAGREQISGQIMISTSLAGLFSSLYTSQGLNKVTLAVLIILAGLFLVVVIFSSLLGLGITRTITSSVATLRAGTERLRRGELDMSIEVRNRDELGDLAKSFNQMTADLRRMLEEVGEKERLEREIQIARQIQVQLLPERLPEVAGFDIAARSEPAFEVGGDYYDALRQDDHAVLIAVGDVSGKGVGAAMLMSNLQANLHVLSAQGLTLKEMVHQLNLQIYRNTTPEMFVTLFLGQIDIHRRSLTYVNAGHDTPALIRDGEIFDLDKGGMLLGVVPEVDYDVGKVKLQAGDLLACYSDGLSEAMDESENEFGRDRLLDTFSRLNGESGEIMVEGVLETVREYAGRERAGRDDLTLMVVRVLDE